jgi:hypothetical protein
LTLTGLLMEGVGHTSDGPSDVFVFFRKNRKVAKLAAILTEETGVCAVPDSPQLSLQRL